MTICKVIRLHGAGGTEVMRIDEIDVPLPGPGQVRLRMKAIGISRGDILYRKGGFPNQPPYPSLMGFEGAGEVESIGEGVSRFSVGDAVSILPLPAAHYGTYGELAIVNAAQLTHHPREMSWEKAAALWANTFTAYNTLVFDGHLQAGEPVVITAASSTVAIAAIQIARKLGAVPIAITRTRKKAARITELGAAHVIVSDEEDIVAAVRNIVGPAGVRLVCDGVSGHMIKPLTEMLSYEGLLLNYGMLDVSVAEFPSALLLVKSLTIKGSNVAQAVADPARLAQARDFILEGFREGIIDPPIDARFQFHEMAKAHELMESNTIAGKVVVLVNP